MLAENIFIMILQHVFSFLSFSDRLNSCLVCKKWLSTMNCKALLRNIIVLIDDNNKVPALLQTSRRFLNFTFKFILVDNKYYELFSLFSSVVEYIEFEKCEIWRREPLIFDDLSYNNLKVLKIIDCDLWNLFTKVPNLSELHLKGNSTITDDGLFLLQKSMKHLTSLTLYCNVTFDPKAYKRFYAYGLSYEKSPSPYILSLPAIKSFISERVGTLRELNLYTNLTPKALKEISSIENLNLHTIGLKNCHECASNLIDLFKNQPNLKILNLNGIMGLSNDSLSALCSLIPDVEEIQMCGCSLTDESFNKVFQLKKLKKLDISQNHASESGFSVAMANFASVNLQSLNVSGILVENIDLLIQKCKYLKHVNLTRCKVSDELLHFISSNLIYLENLILNETDITDFGLTGIDSKQILEATANDLSTPISNLKFLKRLELNLCQKITELGITKAICFPNLEYLGLCGHSIFNETVQILFDQNPCIKKIYCDFSPIEDPRVIRKDQFRFFMDVLMEKFLSD